MQAVMQMTPASVQPNSRGPIAESGCATATGRTKVRRAAVVAVAARGATIPANSTAKPTNPMVTTASDLVRRDRSAEDGEAGTHEEQPEV